MPDTSPKAPDEIAEGLLRGGVELTLVGRGRSMWPVIAPLDRVVARRAGSPRRGDIVVLRTRGGIVTHRVVALLADPARLVTRGDWLDQDDEPVSERDLLAIVHSIAKRRVTIDLRTLRGAIMHRALFDLARVLRIPAVRRVGRALKRIWRD